jgi:hypothetical protein
MQFHISSGWDAGVSYTIYAAGFFVGAMSPEDWLIVLSLIAVSLRLIRDARGLCEDEAKFPFLARQAASFKAFLGRQWNRLLRRK